MIHEESVKESDADFVVPVNITEIRNSHAEVKNDFDPGCISPVNLSNNGFHHVTKAIVGAYYITGGAITNSVIEASKEDGIATFGSPVVGEAMGGAYGVNCSGGIVAVDPAAPGCTVGESVVNHVSV